MNVLIIGNGGREHAIAWRIAQSTQVTKVFVAPGNGGTAHENKLENLALKDPQELAEFAITNNIAFTVVGPEAPLAAGVVDVFRSKNLAIFGPIKAAAQLESSKDYAKAFMMRHNIPTAAYATFNDAAAAHAYIDQEGAPIVIKADGLAAGKGVVVATTLEQAHEAVDDMLGGMFGDASARVVIEGFLQGEEASFIIMCDGKTILPLATSQDHKRLLDKDEGPNTGGMGAYSPAPLVTDALHKRIMAEVIEPTIEGMRKDGIEYTGFLYAGLMIDQKESAHPIIKVLEFNCRMGDPETQPIMMRIKNDFAQVMQLACEQKLDQAHIDWDERTAVGVVLAAANYPSTPKAGDVITGIAQSASDISKTFHAGTSLNQDQQVITSGGRVLCTVALGDSVAKAQKNVYQALSSINFDGMQYRSDIGWRAIAEEKA